MSMFHRVYAQRLYGYTAMPLIRYLTHMKNPNRNANANLNPNFVTLVVEIVVAVRAGSIAWLTERLPMKTDGPSCGGAFIDMVEHRLWNEDMMKHRTLLSVVEHRHGGVTTVKHRHGGTQSEFLLSYYDMYSGV